jgi:plastocyanin
MSNKVTIGIVIVLAILVVFGFFFMRPLTNMLLQSTISPQPMAATHSVPTTPSIKESQASSPTGATANSGTSPVSTETEVLLNEDVMEAVVVTYTGSGFEPSTVEVQNGQMVTFVNQSNRNMWVGADDHPTHTKYPVKSPGDCLGSSFDSCGGLAVGESWSFTFTEVGSWGYHNHSQAAHRGTVVVK